MKTFLRIILPLLVLLQTTACKNHKVGYDVFSFQDEIIQAEANRVKINGSFSFSGYVSTMKINIGKDENLADAKQYSMNLFENDFSVTVDSLQPATQYYYCYSIDFGMQENYHTETASFSTLVGKPRVNILDVLAVDSTVFRIKCIVVDDGGLPLTEKGICWNTLGNPTLDDHVVQYPDNTNGTFICLMDDLEYNTVYYVNAYARNEAEVVGYGEPMSFRTGGGSLIAPTVITGLAEVTNDSVVCHGEVIDEGTNPVVERGICWSTQHDPNIEGDHASDGSGMGAFSVIIKNFSPNETYYYRAYAIADNDTIRYGEENDFNIVPLTHRYSITVSTNNNGWGVVSGGGEYDEGLTCVITATANDGYVFVNWTENTVVVSENASYSFTVATNRVFVANFAELATATLPTVITLPVTDFTETAAHCKGDVTDDGGAEVTQKGICWGVSADPDTVGLHTNDGSGIGSFESDIAPLAPNTTYYVRAYAINSVGIRYGENQSFQTQEPTPQPPAGAINGQFSVGNGTAVYFSKGNLQYIGSASTPYWKFADNQWNVLGTSTNQNTNSDDVNRDLFGWGTSGYNHNNACYQPWSTAQTDNNYYAYGGPQYNLFDQDGAADWGYNAIINGGNQNQKWRTLTIDEWKYVFNERHASSINGMRDARYAKATVNGKSGVILFPDEYVHPTGLSLPSSINNPAADYGANYYNGSAWTDMENNGCVFLPTSGRRLGTTFMDGDNGYYWSSSSGGGTVSSSVHFNSSSFNPLLNASRSMGMSVRLVHSVE